MDGIYAIVLTLLVLDLKMPQNPEVSNAELMTDLIHQIPNFIAYLISFLVVVIFWMRNRWILKPFTKSDETIFLLNLFHVFFLSLIPYTSSLIGHYEQDSLPVMNFSSSLGLCGLSLLLTHRDIITKTAWIGETPSRHGPNPIG